ncbi:DUF4391 domain-containing protein [Priestia megaterium]|uniref:DUF4391 domain-containing protein n=1 Tax=Priestia megaterium TaxID=1404 RepID=UPI0015970796|nr:DUF4391 domain-containing protein [Priestia megaterium]
MNMTLSMIHDVEASLSNFQNKNLYKSGLKLFQALNYPVIPLDIAINQNFNEYYLNFDKKILFNPIEYNFMKGISSVSLLFSINKEFFSSTQIQFKDDFFSQILFLAIELNSSKRDRSFDAHTITKILNKMYKHPIFILFFHDDHILFSAFVKETTDEEQGGEVFLSNWYSCTEIDNESISNLCNLSFANQTQHSLKELYYDIIYSMSRHYYIYPDSHEYITYGNLTSELRTSIIEETIIEPLKTIIELSTENSKYYHNLYNDDYVDNNEDIKLLVTEDDDLFLIDLDVEDFSDVELEVGKIDEVFEENSEGNEQSSLSDLDDAVFDDPLKMLEWLDSEDNE